jgi:hypothetical protein
MGSEQARIQQSDKVFKGRAVFVHPMSCGIITVTTIGRTKRAASGENSSEPANELRSEEDYGETLGIT